MAPLSQNGIFHVQFAHEVETLAEDILDPSRGHAVVCVTTPSWGAEPLVDADALAASLGAAARVYVMPTGRASWDLSSRLPPRLDVYGGATRVWWPDVLSDGDPFRNPLFFVHAGSGSSAVIDQIVQRFEAEGLLRSEVPEAGTEVGAVVTAVRPWGADLELASGERAFALLQDLSPCGLKPARIVELGQSVRVSVLDETRGGRVRVTLAPFAPDLWRRFEELHPTGTVVPGIVVELRRIGAFVQVFPGVKGLLHTSKITSDWVSHPADVLETGDVAPVRIVSIDREQEKVELSLLGVREGDVVAPGALLPGGPPWLDTSELAFDEDEVEAEEAEAAAEPLRVEPEPDEVAAQGAAPEATPADEPISVPEPSVDTAPLTVGDDLERLIEEATDVQRQVGELFVSAERRLLELRAEAGQIRRVLEDDLTQARLRILRFSDTEASAVTGSAEAALEDARRQVEDLGAQLAAAEDDRRAALLARADEQERASNAVRITERRGKELSRARAAAAVLERELSELDPAERFVGSVRAAWEHATPEADRPRYPWREPTIGPGFLASLDAVEGIGRQRVVEVCAHVVSGRARELPGIEVHALRSSESGGTPQLRREDGAKAFRCSLQTNTPAARRLHYWELPGGGMELARIVYHDDFSIG